MRFDIILTLAQRPGIEAKDVFTEAVADAKWAEQLGYQGIWVLEHHFTKYSLCASAITMASFLLGRTQRIRVGTAVTVVPLEHPIKLAERVAMLDHLSGGRFDFGLGRGTYARDYEAFGVDITRNHIQLRETTDGILRAWGKDPVSVRGLTDSTLEALPVIPKPFTSPHPPIYVASSSNDTVAWAAEHGFPLLIREAADNESKRELLRAYSEAAVKAGRPARGLDHALTCIAVLGDSDAGARDHVRTHMAWWLAEGASSNGLLARRHLLPNYQTYFDAIDAGKKAGAKDPSAIVDRMLSLNLVGTPARCRERLSEMCESFGIRHFILGFDANTPGQETRDVMERFMSEVIAPVAKQFPDSAVSS
jgi:alkanal monooxygenase alpha chain